MGKVKNMLIEKSEELGNIVSDAEQIVMNLQGHLEDVHEEPFPGGMPEPADLECFAEELRVIADRLDNNSDFWK